MDLSFSQFLISILITIFIENPLELKAESSQNIDLLFTKNEETKKQTYTKIVLIGETGSGKSAIGNCLLAKTKKKFIVSESTDSCTRISETIEGNWIGNNMPCSIIDTPGLNDSSGQDNAHIRNIVEHLKEEKYVNAFVIVRNGTCFRMANSIKSMLAIFELMFGKSFWKHVIIDVSNVKYSHVNVDENHWKLAIKNNFPQAVDANLPTVFLDAMDFENLKFKQNLESLWNFCNGMDEFGCKDFASTKAEVDRLKDDQKEFEKNHKHQMDMLENRNSLLEEEMKNKLKALLDENEKLRSMNESETLIKDFSNKKKQQQSEKTTDDKLKFFIGELNKNKVRYQKEINDYKNICDQLLQELSKTQKCFEENYIAHKPNENGSLVTEFLDKLSESEKTTQEQIKLLNIKQKMNEDRHKKEIDHYKKIVKKFEEEVFITEKNFEEKYPALKANGNVNSAWKTIHGNGKIKQEEKGKYFNYGRLMCKQKAVVKDATTGVVAARIMKVEKKKYFKQNKPTKVILFMGMTGSGKSTLIDALINYVYDVHYEDTIRLKLISLTAEELKKQKNQAKSQTDFISVYKVFWTPGMNIDYNLVVIDTPGLLDTRGIDNDKNMIQNIKMLFNSKHITTLNAVGFVVKAGDFRLTPAHKYLIEGILSVFGHDMKDKLLGMLTFFDGYEIKAQDAFKEANVQLVQYFPFNSASIFRERTINAIDNNILTKDPAVSNFQLFYNMSKNFFSQIHKMQPISLQLTQAVLSDREKIEATITGLSIRIKDLLLLKDQVDQEKRICQQHEADAKANEETEYEVVEQKSVVVNLNQGEHVTNCLECNVTCHYPCYIPKDKDKYGCAAMNNNSIHSTCTVCAKKCCWNLHVNNQYKFDFETITVKKTYEDIKARFKEHLDKHRGQVNIVQALEKASSKMSKEIQLMVKNIIDCLRRLKKNALRSCNTSASQYLEQMIMAEDMERKNGFQSRIRQLEIEKSKADTLADIASSHDIDKRSSESSNALKLKKTHAMFGSKT